MTYKNKLSKLALLLLTATMTFVTSCNGDADKKAKADEKGEALPEIKINDKSIKSFIADTIKGIKEDEKGALKKNLTIDSAEKPAKDWLVEALNALKPSDNTKDNADDALIALGISRVFTALKGKGSVGEGEKQSLQELPASLGLTPGMTTLEDKHITFLFANIGDHKITKEQQKKYTKTIDENSQKAMGILIKLATAIANLS